MNAPDLTTLRLAESTATEAQERLAKLESIQRGAVVAMMLAGEAALRSLDPESLKLIDWDALSYRVTKGVGKAMDQVLISAEDHANDAANYVDDLMVQAEEAAHAARVMPAHSMAEAAE